MSYRGQRFCLLADVVAVVERVVVGIAAPVVADVAAFSDFAGAIVAAVRYVVGSATVGNASAVYVDSDLAVGATVDVALKLLQLILSQSVMM